MILHAALYARDVESSCLQSFCTSVRCLSVFTLSSPLCLLLSRPAPEEPGRRSKAQGGRGGRGGGGISSRKRVRGKRNSDLHGFSWRFII